MVVGVGSTLGRYRLEASLGKGGMAEVFRATDQRLGRAVAVKVILPGYAEQPRFVERFLREARLVAALEHPNIVPVYDFGEHQGVPFLVMPFLEGGTLAERLTGQPLPLRRVADWVRQLAEALDAAHQQGILHRDVKPGNVLIGKGDRLMLADFGIAKMVDSATRLTATGSVIGTPMYMAPELAQGRPASVESDLYALGVMAYEMVTGRPPFSGDSALSVLHQHVHTPPPRPSTTGADLPAALDEVLAAALAKAPDARPNPGRVFAERLEDALGIASPPVTFPLVPAAVPPSGLPPPGVTPGGVSPARMSPAGMTDERTTLLPTKPAQPTVAGVGGRLVIALLLAAVAISGWLSFGRLRREAASVAAPPPAAVAESAGAGAAAEPVATSAGTPAETPRGPLAERLRARAGGARLSGRLPRPSGAEAQRELPRPGTTRMAAADFERLRDLASRGERAGNARAAFLLAYADGGLSYLARDDEGAAEKLRELGRLDNPVDLGPLSLLRKLAGTGSPDPWVMAVAYGDPRRAAAAAIAAELSAHPENLAALFAQALVAHLDGNHRAAAEVASQVLGRVPQAHAARTAIYLAEEREHAGDRQAALAAYRRVAETRAPEAGFAAVQGARVALELQLPAEARRVLESACRNQARLACERLRQLEAAQ